MGGVAKLRSRLPEIMAELPVRTEGVAMEVAQMTATAAQERADALYQGDKPFSIEAGHHGRDAAVFADWFWFFGEFGTVHQPARPFMVPALETAVHEVAAMGRAALEDL